MGWLHVMVTNFDMIEGVEVYWWGAYADDFENLTNGFIISDEKLNRTYKNDSMVVRLTNYTLDQFKVLGVWDMAMVLDFGHVLLEVVNEYFGYEGFSPSPTPSPSKSSPNGSTYSGGRVKRGAKQSVIFDNYIELAPNFCL